MTNPFTALRYLLVAFGVFAVLSGIGRLAPPANAASTGAESKLADLESRLQRAEMRISELTSAKKRTRQLTAERSGTTRIRAPFEVVGPSGNVLMRVYSQVPSGTGAVDVNDNEGKVKARIRVDQRSAGQFVAFSKPNANGGGMAILGLGKDTASGIVDLTSSDGEHEVHISSGNAVTGPYVNLQTNTQINASLNGSDRHGQLVIFNGRGKAVVNATTNPAGQGEVVITGEDQTVRAFIRSLGDDGDACVVRKGQIHCLNIGIPMGGR
jgi:hypothetical protein